MICSARREATMSENQVCRSCPVRDRALCVSLADEELCGLRLIARKRQVTRNQIVCWAGEEALICANVVTGMFKDYASAADGRYQKIGRASCRERGWKYV